MQQPKTNCGRAIALASLLSAFAAAAVPTMVYGQSAGDTLRLATVLELVAAQNPRVTSASYQAEAARHRVGPAGAPSDPQVTVGIMNRPLSLAADQAMTMDMIRVTQRFPWPGTLSLREDRYSELAASAESMVSNTLLETQYTASAIYFELAFIDRARSELEETWEILEDLVSVTQSSFEVGRAGQQDVLQTQVAVQEVLAEIEMLAQRRGIAESRLNSLLSRNVQTPIRAVRLPTVIDRDLSVDSLIAVATEAHPLIAGSRQRIRAHEFGAAAARRAGKPDFTVTLAYSERPQFVDLATLSVGLRIPLWTSRRETQQRLEFELMGQAETAALQSTLDDLAEEVAAAVARAEAAGRLWEIYGGTAIEQATATYQASLSAYRAGALDYDTVLKSLLKINELSVKSYRALADFNIALARIRYLTGDAEGGVR